MVRSQDIWRVEYSDELMAVRIPRMLGKVEMWERASALERHVGVRRTRETWSDVLMLSAIPWTPQAHIQRPGSFWPLPQCQLVHFA